MQKLNQYKRQNIQIMSIQNNIRNTRKKLCTHISTEKIGLVKISVCKCLEPILLVHSKVDLLSINWFVFDFRSILSQ